MPVIGKKLLTYDEVKGRRDARKEVKLRQPMVKKNKERQGQRVTEGRDPDYLAWIRQQPCVVTGREPGEPIRARSLQIIGRTFIVAAHMKAGRTGETDSTALPLDSPLHDEQHRIGIKTWAKLHRLDIPALIAAHRKRYALEMAAKLKAKSETSVPKGVT